MLKALLSSPDRYFVKSIFPIIGSKLNYNSLFIHDSSFARINDFELSGYVLNPGFRDFFNHFFMTNLTISVNSAIPALNQFDSWAPYLPEGVRQYFDTAVFHRNSSYYIFENTSATVEYSKNKNLFHVLPRYLFAERAENESKTSLHSHVFSSSLANQFLRAFFKFRSGHLQPSFISRIRYLNSAYFALSSIDDEASIHARRVFLNSYTFFSE